MQDTIKSAPSLELLDSRPTRAAAWWLWLEERIASERAANATVLLFGAVLFLPMLGSVGLWDPWETHYAEVAREMLVRRDFIYPHWESAYFFSKPALPIWLMAASMALFGVEPHGTEGRSERRSSGPCACPSRASPSSRCGPSIGSPGESPVG
ncbi:MAG: hypothetical protein HC923_01570 [Myxococcales bacterium]|nr:hypothetical protein [Myxococcales bacterium]